MQIKITISLFMFHSWVLVTNAGRILLTKNKKIILSIFNYFCRACKARIFVLKISTTPAIGKSR